MWLAFESFQVWVVVEGEVVCGVEGFGPVVELAVEGESVWQGEQSCAL